MSTEPDQGLEEGLSLEHKGQICNGCPRHPSKRCGSSKIDAEVDVLFIAEQPDRASVDAGTPMAGHGGKVLTTALKAVIGSDKRYKELRYAFTYAVQCISETEDETAAPNKEVVHHCRPYLQGTIQRFNPKVIVAMGSTALRQLGVKQQYNDIRNKFTTHLGYNAPIYATFSEKALLAAPGVFETFKLNLINIFDKVVNKGILALPLEEVSKDYLLPKTMDDALAACDVILNYGSATVPAAHWSISVDTETTTLYPEKEGARIIAFCFGWDAGKSATILYDHPHAGEEYLARLPELTAKIREILASTKPKILHNAKFDLKFIELKYGMPVNAVAWDTLLGEHLLDEDKKGNYGLKVLTANFLPQYCGYEDKLYDLLNDEESASKVDEAEKELEDLREIIATEHPGYLKSLEEYKEALVVYEADKQIFDVADKAYQFAYDDYLFCKSALAGKQAAWDVEVSDWPKGKRGKPKKPVKWFSKPEKPAAVKEPKKPEDPRSKKEQQISKDAGFENLPIHDLQVYGAVDGDVTRQLARLQRRRIAKEQSKVVPLMKSHAVPASRVLGRMEFGGMRVDIPYIDVLEEAFTNVIEKTEKELYEMTRDSAPPGKEINLNGAATLANVLYNWGWTHPNGKKMDAYEILAYTKKGQASTSEKILRQFVAYEDDKKQCPTETAYFIERLIKYRKASKARNTFLANIRALSKRDGFLHTQFHLNGTGTGRLSSSDMNMQNLPKFLAGWNLKKLFLPDDDSMVFVNMDYKGAEVRVFCAYARDPALIQALNDGMDMHSFFAAKVFKRPYEMYARRDDAAFIPDGALRKLLDQERSNIKRVVFGILYGAGPEKISETIGVSVDEAKVLIALLYQMFPEIALYATNVELEVARDHFVETFFGRRRRFPLAGISRHAGRAKRQGRNFKIQSTSSDIVIGQLIEMEEPLRCDLGGRMLLTVHDSIAFQLPKRHIGQLHDFVEHYAKKRVADKYAWMAVPFEADTEIGENYGECQSIAKYLAKHPLLIQPEGVIEENELLTELRNDAFEAA